MRRRCVERARSVCGSCCGACTERVRSVCGACVEQTCIFTAALCSICALEVKIQVKIQVCSTHRSSTICALEAARSLQAICTFAAALSSMEGRCRTAVCFSTARPPDAGMEACSLTTCTVGCGVVRCTLGTQRVCEGHSCRGGRGGRSSRTYRGTAAETLHPAEVAGAGWPGRGWLVVRHLSIADSTAVLLQLLCCCNRTASFCLQHRRCPFNYRCLTGNYTHCRT